jgi:hypothetical protein
MEQQNSNAVEQLTFGGIRVIDIAGAIRPS